MGKRDTKVKVASLDKSVWENFVICCRDDLSMKISGNVVLGNGKCILKVNLVLFPVQHDTQT